MRRLTESQPCLRKDGSKRKNAVRYNFMRRSVCETNRQNS